MIFDEATSALDYESERIVQRNMRAIAKGRSVFIIAHRLSAVRHADRILVLADGQVVEDGSHGELLVRQGQYARLHALQQGVTGAADDKGEQTFEPGRIAYGEGGHEVTQA